MRLLPFDYAARNAGRRPVQTFLVTMGSGAVVFLVLLMGSFVESLTATMRETGSAHNVIVLGSGSEDFLEQSEIGREVPTILAASVPAIVRHGEQPLVSPEIHHATILRPAGNAGAAEAQRDSAAQSTVLIRGVTPAAWLVHRQVFLTEGRLPKPGEVLVGKLAPAKLGLPPEALRPGSKVEYEGLQATVSGSFEAPGTAFESEVWVPLDDLLVQTKRATLTCAVVRLNDPARFSDVQIFAKTRLDLEIAAVRESEYYSALARFLRPVQVMGWAMAGLVVVAGLFGGLNAMLAAISARTREIACLETVGYRRTAITVSLLQESMLQAGTGALLAVAAAQFLLDGVAVRITMGAVSLQLGPQVVLAGFAAAALLAVIGTLAPAVRLLRVPLVEQLRG